MRIDGLHGEELRVLDGTGSGEVVVSVQATGMERAPWDGHRAVGLLATEDLVLVPDSPQELVDAAQWFEVLIIPTAGRGGEPIERIGVAGVEALRRVGDGRVTSVVLQLARWSRYPAMMASFDGCEFKRRVRERDGDVWATLVDVGAIRPGLDVVLDEVLRTVPELELAQRLRRIRFHEHRFPGDDADIFCDLVKWPCQPCRP
jgi:hypothetical protein